MSIGSIVAILVGGGVAIGFAVFLIIKSSNGGKGDE